jgi:tungstate transport system substrate-binding protein
MYNDFLIVGPLDDPAGTKEQSPSKAFAAIAAKGAPFVSRGDNSGTHKKELSIWEKAGIEPSGDWYISAGQGMGESTRIANEKQAYILIDRGTYLSLKKTLKLVVLVEGQKELFNLYGVIVVDKAKFPRVNSKDAVKFASWITSPEIQKMIGEFGKKKYGQALFVPNAK